MYSTTTIVKNSKLSGKIVGTHQRIDQAARRVLTRYIPRGKYFPSSKEIIHFEGTRGPDGLKRKSPGVDEPSHMLAPDDLDGEALKPSEEAGHEQLDQRSLLTLIHDHRWNLVRALKNGDHVRASFEAAWMAHMITDGLTPAHHFPLSSVKDELMTDKEMVKVFGSPMKGIMHGRNMLETLRNNWLYWGAGGHMSAHIAYEYGVLMIVAATPTKRMLPRLGRTDFCAVDTEAMFRTSLEKIQNYQMFDRFRTDGWTTELAIETRDVLMPEIVKAVALAWYSAIEEAYGLNRKRTSPKPVQKAKNVQK